MASANLREADKTSYGAVSLPADEPAAKKTGYMKLCVALGVSGLMLVALIVGLSTLGTSSTEVATSENWERLAKYHPSMGAKTSRSAMDNPRPNGDNINYDGDNFFAPSKSVSAGMLSALASRMPGVWRATDVDQRGETPAGGASLGKWNVYHEGNPSPTWRHGYKWASSRSAVAEDGWGQCYPACGRSVRFREITCIRSDETVVGDTNCHDKNKPEIWKHCTNHTECHPCWAVGKWSECNRQSGCAEGGDGKSRSVYCTLCEADWVGVTPKKLLGPLNHVPVLRDWDYFDEKGNIDAYARTNVGDDYMQSSEDMSYLKELVGFQTDEGSQAPLPWGQWSNLMRRFLTPQEGMGWGDDDVCRYGRAGICNPPHKDMVGPSATEDPASWNWDTEVGQSLKYNKRAYFCGFSTAPEDCDSEQKSREAGFFQEFGSVQIENGVECRAYVGDSTPTRVDHPCVESVFGMAPYETARGEVKDGEFSMGSRMVRNHPHFPDTDVVWLGPYYAETLEPKKTDFCLNFCNLEYTMHWQPEEETAFSEEKDPMTTEFWWNYTWFRDVEGMHEIEGGCWYPDNSISDMTCVLDETAEGFYCNEEEVGRRAWPGEFFQMNVHDWWAGQYEAFSHSESTGAPAEADGTGCYNQPDMRTYCKLDFLQTRGFYGTKYLTCHGQKREECLGEFGETIDADTASVEPALGGNAKDPSLAVCGDGYKKAPYIQQPHAVCAEGIGRRWYRCCRDVEVGHCFDDQDNALLTPDSTCRVADGFSVFAQNMYEAIGEPIKCLCDGPIAPRQKAVISPRFRSMTHEPQTHHDDIHQDGPTYCPLIIQESTLTAINTDAETPERAGYQFYPRSIWKRAKCGGFGGVNNAKRALTQCEPHPTAMSPKWPPCEAKPVNSEILRDWINSYDCREEILADIGGRWQCQIEHPSCVVAQVYINCTYTWICNAWRECTEESMTDVLDFPDTRYWEIPRGEEFYVRNHELRCGIDSVSIIAMADQTWEVDPADCRELKYAEEMIECQAGCGMTEEQCRNCWCESFIPDDITYMSNADLNIFKWIDATYKMCYDPLTGIGSPKPATVRQCATDDRCQYFWYTPPMPHCDASCEHKRIERDVWCMRSDIVGPTLWIDDAGRIERGHRVNEMHCHPDPEPQTVTPWHLIMQIGETETFSYGSPYWENEEVLNELCPEEADRKMPAFLNKKFDFIKMCFGYGFEVTNPSFEEDAMAEAEIPLDGVTGWTVRADNPSGAMLTKSNVVPGVLASEGVKYAALAKDVSVTTLISGLNPGQLTKVTVSMMAAAGSEPIAIIRVNSVQYLKANVASGGWMDYSFFVAPTEDSVTLLIENSFDGVGDGRTLFVDNTRVSSEGFELAAQELAGQGGEFLDFTLENFAATIGDPELQDRTKSGSSSFNLLPTRKFGADWDEVMFVVGNGHTFEGEGPANKFYRFKPSGDIFADAKCESGEEECGLDIALNDLVSNDETFLQMHDGGWAFCANNEGQDAAWAIQPWGEHTAGHREANSGCVGKICTQVDEEGNAMPVFDNINPEEIPTSCDEGGCTIPGLDIKSKCVMCNRDRTLCDGKEDPEAERCISLCDVCDFTDESSVDSEGQPCSGDCASSCGKYRPCFGDGQECDESSLETRTRGLIYPGTAWFGGLTGAVNFGDKFGLTADEWQEQQGSQPRVQVFVRKTNAHGGVDERQTNCIVYNFGIPGNSWTKEFQNATALFSAGEILAGRELMPFVYQEEWNRVFAKPMPSESSGVSCGMGQPGFNINSKNWDCTNMRKVNNPVASTSSNNGFYARWGYFSSSSEDACPRAECVEDPQIMSKVCYGAPVSPGVDYDGVVGIGLYAMTTVGAPAEKIGSGFSSKFVRANGDEKIHKRTWVWVADSTTNPRVHGFRQLESLDWNEPGYTVLDGTANKFDNVEKCKKKCLQMEDCIVGLWISGKVRHGECWLSSKKANSTTASEGLFCGADEERQCFAFIKVDRLQLRTCNAYVYKEHMVIPGDDNWALNKYFRTGTKFVIKDGNTIHHDTIAGPLTVRAVLSKQFSYGKQTYVYWSEPWENAETLRSKCVFTHVHVSIRKGLTVDKSVLPDVLGFNGKIHQCQAPISTRYQSPHACFDACREEFMDNRACDGFTIWRSENLLANSGFEEISMEDSEMKIVEDFDANGGWVVSEGSVSVWRVSPEGDYVQAPIGVCGTCDQWLSLNSDGPGTVYQSFPTTPWAQYTIEFHVTGGFHCKNTKDDPNVKTADVYYGDSKILELSVDVSTWDSSNYRWKLYATEVVAQSRVGQLKFVSTNGGCGGIMIDEVKVYKSHVGHEIDEFMGIGGGDTIAASKANQDGSHGEWTTCSNEGQTCECSGTVRYGKGHHWVVQNDVMNSIGCNNRVFGDPLRGTYKECQCKSADTFVHGECSNVGSTLDDPLTDFMVEAVNDVRTLDTFYSYDHPIADTMVCSGGGPATEPEFCQQYAGIIVDKTQTRWYNRDDIKFIHLFGGLSQVMDSEQATAAGVLGCASGAERLETDPLGPWFNAFTVFAGLNNGGGITVFTYKLTFPHLAMVQSIKVVGAKFHNSVFKLISKAFLPLSVRQVNTRDSRFAPDCEDCGECSVIIPGHSARVDTTFFFEESNGEEFGRIRSGICLRTPACFMHSARGQHTHDANTKELTREATPQCTDGLERHIDKWDRNFRSFIYEDRCLHWEAKDRHGTELGIVTDDPTTEFGVPRALGRDKLVYFSVKAADEDQEIETIKVGLFTDEQMGGHSLSGTTGSSYVTAECEEGPPVPSYHVIITNQGSSQIVRNYDGEVLAESDDAGLPLTEGENLFWADVYMREISEDDNEFYVRVGRHRAGDNINHVTPGTDIFLEWKIPGAEALDITHVAMWSDEPANWEVCSTAKRGKPVEVESCVDMNNCACRYTDATPWEDIQCSEQCGPGTKVREFSCICNEYESDSTVCGCYKRPCPVEVPIYRHNCKVQFFNQFPYGYGPSGYEHHYNDGIASKVLTTNDKGLLEDVDLIGQNMDNMITGVVVEGSGCGVVLFDKEIDLSVRSGGSAPAWAHFKVPELCGEGNAEPCQKVVVGMNYDESEIPMIHREKATAYAPFDQAGSFSGRASSFWVVTPNAEYCYNPPPATQIACDEDIACCYVFTRTEWEPCRRNEDATCFEVGDKDACDTTPDIQERIVKCEKQKWTCVEWAGDDSGSCAKGMEGDQYKLHPIHSYYQAGASETLQDRGPLVPANPELRTLDDERRTWTDSDGEVIELTKYLSSKACQVCTKRAFVQTYQDPESGLAAIDVSHGECLDSSLNKYQYVSGCPEPPVISKGSISREWDVNDIGHFESCEFDFHTVAAVESFWCSSQAMEFPNYYTTQDSGPECDVMQGLDASTSSMNGRRHLGIQRREACARHKLCAMEGHGGLSTHYASNNEASTCGSPPRPACGSLLTCWWVEQDWQPCVGCGDVIQHPVRQTVCDSQCGEQSRCSPAILDTEGACCTGEAYDPDCGGCLKSTMYPDSRQCQDYSMCSYEWHVRYKNGKKSGICSTFAGCVPYAQWSAKDGTRGREWCTAGPQRARAKDSFVTYGLGACWAEDALRENILTSDQLSRGDWTSDMMTTTDGGEACKCYYGEGDVWGNDAYGDSSFHTVPNKVYAAQYLMALEGYVTSLSVGIASDTQAGGKVKGALYADDNNAPGVRLAVTRAYTISAKRQGQNSWLRMNFYLTDPKRITLPAGQDLGPGPEVDHLGEFSENTLRGANVRTPFLHGGKYWIAVMVGVGPVTMLTNAEPKRADGSSPGIMSSAENWVGAPQLYAPSDPFGKTGIVGLEQKDQTLSLYATYVPARDQFGRHQLGQCEDAANCDDCTQMIQKDGEYTSQSCVWYRDDAGENKCGVRGYVVDQLGEEPLESCERDWTSDMFLQLKNWACDGERLQNGYTPMLKDTTLEACAEACHLSNMDYYDWMGFSGDALSHKGRTFPWANGRDEDSLIHKIAYGRSGGKDDDTGESGRTGYCAGFTYNEFSSTQKCTLFNRFTSQVGPDDRDPKDRVSGTCYANRENPNPCGWQRGDFVFHRGRWYYIGEGGYYRFKADNIPTCGGEEFGNIFGRGLVDGNGVREGPSTPERYCRGAGKLDDASKPTDVVCSRCLGQMWRSYKAMGWFKDNVETGTCATAYDWRSVQLCNGAVTLSCTEGRLINVQKKREGVDSEEREFFRATYGRTDSSTCVYGAAPLLTDVPSNSVCAQEGNVDAFIKDRCNGKTSCMITRAELDDEIGNSACPLYQKYFKASYRCV